MPEAPEVSVAAAQLAEVAVGRVLRSVTVTHARTMRSAGPRAFDGFAGRRVTAVRRHGKWILVETEGGAVLGIHLRMSGQLLLAEPGDRHPDRHVHATLDFGERVVHFRDPRTFGELRVLFDGAPVAPDLFDPDVTPEALAAASARRAIGVKAVLLDQARSVSGIGSYLADEALHRAGISPLRPADRLTVDDWARLLAAARVVAEESAAVGGVTLADEGWVDLQGRPGRYAQHLRVHARATCATCGAPTARAVVGGRSARWCPACQPQ